jgi:hypothetical protein
MSDKLNKLIVDRSNAIKSENTSVTIKEYIINIRNKYYPDLDISFMEFFMDMYDNNESISAELLAIYGVLSIKPDRKSLHSVTLKNLFKRCHLIENIDYSLRPQLWPQSRGLKYKDVYYLTPKAFKICLISSENETKYRDYYLFLEECIHYYNIGQINNMKEKIEILEEDNNNVSEYVLEQENIIIKKDDEIFDLRYTMNELLKEMKIQNNKLNEQNNKLDKQSEEMTIMQCTLNKIVKKLDDRAIPPSDDELTERFVLMKKNDNTFYVIRSQERRMYKAIQEKEKLGYKKIDDLLESETIPNSMYLWNCIRDELVKERKIKCKYNEIMLSSITELELVDIIKQVFDSRKQVN